MEGAMSLLQRNWGVVLVTVPLGLFVYSRLFPSHTRKAKQKCNAWLLNKVMQRVHDKCGQQKKDLFKAFELVLPTNGSKPSILEIGVGTGNNLSSLPADCNLYCLEPNLECQHYVAKALERHPGVHLSKFVRGFAEDMREFEDNMFDAVICTFTMCSIRRPEKALSEIKRVLKPGGVFFFMEHVAAPKPSTHRTLQEYLDLVWPTVADGCHLTREMWKTVEEAGFSDVRLEHFQIDTKLVFIKFGLYGVAIK